MTSARHNHHPSLFNGPLSKTQCLVLDGMCAGDDQRSIAKRLGFSRGYMSACMSGAVAKMGVRSSWEACALWTRARAYIEAAERLEKSVAPAAEGSVGDHVNRFALELAQLLRERSREILPA